ncbi:conserved hypothetical protein [metagenome]|uniref:Mini-circle protein n=1 Tax=metagenome TaxID=256318 RepID=A0A2P2BZG7_9ZZZZ
MTPMTPIRRTDPPLAVDEATTLTAFLDYHRDTLRLKTADLTQQQLGASLSPSTLTLAGLVKHMALVESSWFSEVFLGEPMMAPFDTADWESDRDWEFTSAPGDAPDELRALFDRAVSRSDAIIRVALDLNGLDGLSAKESRQEKTPFSLRWILVHMIEEYARHNGHADLIRESIDGVTGE